MPSTNIQTKAYPSTHGPITTMFRASASNHRQHKHLTVDLVIDTKLYQHAFALKRKAQSYELKTFFNDLKRASFPSSSKKLRIKPITRIVHTTSMQKSLMTSFTIHPLPTNNSVDNNFQALCATSNCNNLNELWSTNDYNN
jgi:hypothetical protein